MLPPQLRLFVRWKQAIAFIVMASFSSLILISPGSALADDQTSGNSSEGVGIQAASWALTIPYIVAKSAFALTGAIVGGLGYVFSGGTQETAKAVWTTSMYGTYIIRPSHLRGQEPVYFLGIDTQSARIDDLERQLADRDEKLARLRQSSDELDRAKRQVSELTGAMSERDQEIARLKDLSDKSQIEADELEGNVSERDEEIARIKDLMDQKHGDADELDRAKQQMAGLSGAVSERDQEIVRLKGLLDQQRISKAEKDLVKLLQPEISKGNVSVHQFGDQLKINLASDLLFDSGKAELKPAGVEVIKRVGGVLKEFPDKQVHVGGYTDNVPIRGALLETFPSNMDLSKARAEYAMSALEQGGVPKANLTATGHADTEPVADNNTETGRQKNRRVEIVVQ